MNPKRLFPFFLILILSAQLSAQIKFEPGYFIDNNGTKTECLIKNADWVNTPEKVEYKLTGDALPQTKKMADVQEIWVADTKYVRFTVDIDQSSDALSNMSKDKDPEFQQETLFLKCHIEGCASLYESPKHKKFFIRINDSAIFQLVKKNYILENKVTPNNLYKSQLYATLACPSITRDACKNTGYTKSGLKKIVSKYNECKSCQPVTFKGRKKNNAFNLAIKPGFRMSWLNVENWQPPIDNVDYGKELTMSLGLEAEYILPINKNKWSLTFEPTYQYYKTKDPRPYHTNEVDYSSLELPIGFRYYMFISDKSKLFLSASLVLFDIPLHSEIGSLEIGSTRNFTFGFGYNHHHWLSAELRYGTVRDLLSDYVFYRGNYQSVSLTLGIKVFSKTSKK